MNWFLVFAVTAGVTLSMCLVLYMFNSLTFGLLLAFVSSSFAASMLMGFILKAKKHSVRHND